MKSAVVEVKLLDSDAAREMIAAALEALDLLGVALSNEGHIWTDEERAAYDKAIRLLGVK